MCSVDIVTRFTPNPNDFECQMCLESIEKETGIRLEMCSHDICKTCLKNHVISCNTIPTPCPLECESHLLDTESRAFLDEAEQELYYQKSLQMASAQLKNGRNCRTPNCTYFLEIDGYFQEWTCPVCQAVNCLNCNVVHRGESCEQYEIKRNKELKHIEKMITDKKMMRCPFCKSLIQMNRGCNLVTCSDCMNDLCWVRQMARWGPKGPGDQTGGCQCGLGGKRCHRDCDIGCIPHKNVTYFPTRPDYFPENNNCADSQKTTCLIL